MSIKIQSSQTIRNGITLKGSLPGYPYSYRYWKFSVTRIGNPVPENNKIWQICELVLKYRGQRVDYSTATAYSTPGAVYNYAESPAQAIDNNPATKLCMQASEGGFTGSSGLGWPLIIDFGKTVTADSMTYFTGNDTPLVRDPIDWILWGSADGTNWDPVQWTVGYSPPSDRSVETKEFNFNIPFDNHITVPTVTGGTNGNDTFTAWTVPNANNDALIPVGAIAFGTNLNNHIGGIYSVTANVLDGGYQKITVQDGTLSTVFNVTNVGSNEPFEVYWYNGVPINGLQLYLDATNGSSYPGSGTTWFDLSGNSRDATLENGASFDTNSINFDYTQSQYAVIAPTSMFNGDMTAIGWVYVRSIQTWSRLFDFGNGPNNNNVILAVDNNGTGNPAYSTDGADNIYSPAPLPLNQWVQLASTQSGTTGTIYINGTPVVTATNNEITTVSRDVNYIGRSNWSNDSYLDGKIAALKIYNRTLSQSEITADYTAMITRLG